MGPTVTGSVQEPLVVLLLDNQLYKIMLRKFKLSNSVDGY